MEQKLEQRQVQRLILTQSMQQAMKLLALPTLELKTYLENSAQENPFLELQDKNIRDAAPVREQEEPLSLREPDEIAQRRDYKEGLITKAPTLEDDLLRQLSLLDLSPPEKKAAEFIIGDLDDNGYIRTGLTEISKLTGTTLEDVEGALRTIQEFDPPGVAARDLAECILIQLRRRGLDGSVAAEIAKGRLQDLAKRNYEKIAAALKISVDDVKEAHKLISKLDPKPASGAYTKESEAAIPDVEIKQKEDGFEISLTDNVPSASINSDYKKLLKEKRDSAGERAYLAKNLSAARGIVSGLRSRNDTILRVVEEIFRHQSNFLREGPAYIKPMRLKDIAGRLGLHQSTVSRVVSAKYIDTPLGVYPLKFFFSKAVNTDSGEDVSTKKIKEELRGLVAAEEKSNPLSDEDIVKLFKAKGIKIARRTIAKYREKLRILPSHLRKE